MNTSYDEIFQCFLDNCGVDTSELPQEQSKMYQMIRNGVNHYNNMIENEYSDIVMDDTTETINTSLDSTHLLILAYCIRYTYLENQLIGFEEIWSPFQKELGIKNYKDQVNSRERTLERTKNKIIELISNVEEKNIMD